MYRENKKNRRSEMRTLISSAGGGRMGMRALVGILALVAATVIALPLSAQAVSDKLIVKDSGNNTKFVVTDETKVGIGTATPEQLLHVSGGIVLVDNVGNTSYNAGFSFQNANASFPAAIAVGGAGNPNFLANWNLTNGSQFDGTKLSLGVGLQVTNDQIVFMRAPAGGGFSNLMTLKGSTGYLGIGISPSYPLHMASGAYVTEGGVWTNASSRAYKENITELTTTEASEVLAKLDPVKYNYKIDASDKHVGFIAEDVPDLVATKDRKGLSPMDIVAVLTKVVQEQQKTITELSRQVKLLSHEVRLSRSVAVVETR